MGAHSFTMLKSEKSISSSFHECAWVCQGRMDSSVSTSEKLHFFESILTYFWRQKNQKYVAKNEIYVMGPQTNLYLLLYILF